MIAAIVVTSTVLVWGLVAAIAGRRLAGAKRYIYLSCMAVSLLLCLAGELGRTLSQGMGWPPDGSVVSTGLVLEAAAVVLTLWSSIIALVTVSRSGAEVR